YIKYKERPLRLEIPEAPILANPNINPQEIAASDKTLVKVVRRHCVQWTNEIGQTLIALANKEISMHSPSAELVHWKDQVDTLRSLSDEYHNIRIVNGFLVLRQSEKKRAAEFSIAHCKLSAQLKVAESNVRVLRALKPSFTVDCMLKDVKDLVTPIETSNIDIYLDESGPYWIELR
ncbi:hypothetical protein WDU94_004529, partial [Cyamophila willieti]